MHTPSIHSCLLATTLALVLTTPALANTLGIDLSAANPRILANDGTVTYNSSTQVLHASGTASLFVDTGVPGGSTSFDPASNPQITIDLFVNHSGQFAGNGTGFTLTGALDFDSDGTNDVSGTLLTGSITDFGASSAGPAPWSFDGIFNITGGSLTQGIPLSGGGSLPGPFTIGEKSGFTVAVDQQVSGTLGDFTSSFNGSDAPITAGSLRPLFLTPLPTPLPTSFSAGLPLLATTMACLLRNRFKKAHV